MLDKKHPILLHNTALNARLSALCMLSVGGFWILCFLVRGRLVNKVGFGFCFCAESEIIFFFVFLANFFLNHCLSRQKLMPDVKLSARGCVGGGTVLSCLTNGRWHSRVCWRAGKRNRYCSVQFGFWILQCKERRSSLESSLFHFGPQSINFAWLDYWSWIGLLQAGHNFIPYTAACAFHVTNFVCVCQPYFYSVTE